MRKSFVAPLAAALFTLLAAPALLADEPAPGSALDEELARYTTRLPEVVVTTEQPYEVPLDYGGSRAVIPPEEIRESGAAQIAELLSRRPGTYYFDEAGNDTKPNISLRGLNPQRSIEMCMLVDGIPLNPAPYSHPGLSLFPFALERVRAIDIIRGGHAVLYGPNNVAGVVNLLSNPIPLEPMFEHRFRYGSWAEYSSYSAAGGTFGDFGFLLEAVGKGGETYRDNGDYTVQNYGAKSFFRLAERVDLLVQADYYREDSQQSGGLSQAAYRQDPWQSLTGEDWFDGDQLRGNVRLGWDISDADRLEIFTYVFGGERTFYLGQPVQYGDTPTKMRSTPRPMTVWAIQPQYQTRFDLLGVEHRFVVGTRYLHELLLNRRYAWNWPGGDRTKDISQRFYYGAWSGWVQDSFEPLPRLVVTPGVRYENLAISAQDRLKDLSHRQNMAEFLPGLSATYGITTEWAVYSDVQRTFRAPEYNRVGLSTAGIEQDQNLSPEMAWAYEIGTRATLLEGGLFFDVDFFLIDFSGRFQQDPQRENVFYNIGRQRNRGIEAYLESALGVIAESLEDFRAFLGYTLTDTKVLRGKYEGNDARQAPPHKFTYGVDWRHECGLFAGVDGAWVDDSFADESNQRAGSADGMLGRQPSFRLWNARVGYALPVEQERGELSLQAGVNNVFDEEYFARRTEKGIMPGVPRNYYVGLAFRWRF